MDIQPQNQQPISDDQELAKVLAGVSQQADTNLSDLQFEETPNNGQQLPQQSNDQSNDQPQDTAAPVIPEPPEIPEPPVEMPAPEQVAPQEPVPAPAGNSDLESIKKDALSELRPLIDKLDVTPEEKFDTLLLIIRSTDDQSLLAATHEAAKAIPDDSRRAQALLDIIKEIDFFSNKAQ